MSGDSRIYRLIIDEELPDLPEALCKGLDTDLVGDVFFPDLRAFGTPKEKRLAMGQASYFCSRCPEREPCLEFALRNPVDGIWGGMSPVQRRNLMRARAAS